MQIEVYEIDNHNNFIEEHSSKMTEYIRSKIYDSALRLIDDMYLTKSDTTQRKHYIYLSTTDNIICGFLYFYYITDFSYSNLFGIYIDPEYRRRSIADNIIRKAINYLIDIKIKDLQINLAVNRDGVGPKYYLNDYCKKLINQFPLIRFNIQKSE